MSSSIRYVLYVYQILYIYIYIIYLRCLLHLWVLYETNMNLGFTRLHETWDHSPGISKAFVIPLTAKDRGTGHAVSWRAPAHGSPKTSGTVKGVKGMWKILETSVPKRNYRHSAPTNVGKLTPNVLSFFIVCRPLFANGTKVNTFLSLFARLKSN